MQFSTLSNYWLKVENTAWTGHILALASIKAKMFVVCFRNVAYTCLDNIYTKPEDVKKTLEISTEHVINTIENTKKIPATRMSVPESPIISYKR